MNLNNDFTADNMGGSNRMILMVVNSIIILWFTGVCCLH